MASRPPGERGPFDDAVGRNRWLVMQVARFAGFGLVILGILMTRGVVPVGGSNGRLVGYALIVIGLADGFIVPQVLARKWRSPRP
jgi:hypothetical protein